MTIKIGSAEDFMQAGLAAWGISGAVGTGKSTLVASIPPEIPTLVVSVGPENIKPYMGKPWIKLVKVFKWQDLLEILQLFRRAYRDGVDPNSVKFFKAIAFDTASRLQALAIHRITGYDATQLTDEQLARFIMKVPESPKGYDNWYQIGGLLNEWSGYYLSLPVHKIFLYQEGTREPKIAGELHLTGPALTPMSAVWTSESLELIGRLWVDYGGPQDALTVEADRRVIDVNATEKHMLLIGKHDAYVTKGPTHVLGRVVENPTWDRLVPILSASPYTAPPNGGP